MEREREKKVDKSSIRNFSEREREKKFLLLFCERENSKEKKKKKENKEEKEKNRRIKKSVKKRCMGAASGGFTPYRWASLANLDICTLSLPFCCPNVCHTLYTCPLLTLFLP